VQAFLSDGSPAPIVTQTVSDNMSDSWRRHYQSFSVPKAQSVQIAVVPAAEGGDPTVPHKVDIAAPMLEFGVDTPSVYQGTNAQRSRFDFACRDEDGAAFRDRFADGCVRLCSNGFDGECEAADAAEHCYKEVHVSLSQRDIESGRQLANVGFALGNFNYRIEGISVNVVGTGVRDCSAAESPSSCYSDGFIPYSISHAGPYFVRNHMGQDFKAELFRGNIEHARALATERYITNPVSGADRELITPYTRTEFQGRPLDGNFTIRIWDDPTIDFSRIRDIQVVLDYRYWTRFD